MLVRTSMSGTVIQHMFCPSLSSWHETFQGRRHGPIIDLIAHEHPSRQGRHLYVVLGISTLAEVSLQEEAKTCPE
jgi:hypothetical protein